MPQTHLHLHRILDTGPKRRVVETQCTLEGPTILLFPLSLVVVSNQFHAAGEEIPLVRTGEPSGDAITTDMRMGHEHHRLAFLNDGLRGSMAEMMINHCLVLLPLGFLYQGVKVVDHHGVDEDPNKRFKIVVNLVFGSKRGRALMSGSPHCFMIVELRNLAA